MPREKQPQGIGILSTPLNAIEYEISCEDEKHEEV
jgi:hypothetical protein